MYLYVKSAMVDTADVSHNMYLFLEWKRAKVRAKEKEKWWEIMSTRLSVRMEMATIYTLLVA